MKDGGVDFAIARYDRSSMVWKRIMNCASLLTDMTCWSIGNDCKILFWTHKWINDVDVLADHSLVPLTNDNRRKSVAEFVVDGDWNLPVLCQVLPDDLIN